MLNFYIVEKDVPVDSLGVNTHSFIAFNSCGVNEACRKLAIDFPSRNPTEYPMLVTVTTSPITDTAETNPFLPGTLFSQFVYHTGPFLKALIKEMEETERVT